jgi:uncharacterized CHY-type Zn-finger protein
MARTAHCLLRGHYTTSLSGKTTNVLPLMSTTHMMFLPTFSQYLYVSLNAASPFSYTLPHLESGKFSNSKLNTKMQAADFPTVRFGAGPGSRSRSCDICMMQIYSFDDSATHTTCHNSFHLSCFTQWADTQHHLRRSTTCPMCRAQLNTPQYHQLELTDYEIHNGLARIEVERVRRPPHQRRPNSPDRYSSSSFRENYDRNHLVEHDRCLSRVGSSGRGSQRSSNHGYSSVSRMQYASGGRDPVYGERDIARSSRGDQYRSSSVTGRGRLWEDIHELEG